MGQILATDHQVDVADGAKLVAVARRTVVDDLEMQFGLAAAVFVRPGLEIGGKFVVGDDVNVLNPRHRGEVVEHPIDHRLAGHFQQRLGFVEGQRVETGRVAGGKNEDVHGFFEIGGQSGPGVQPLTAPLPPFFCSRVLAET